MNFMMGVAEPVVLEKEGKEYSFPSIRQAWLQKLRGPHDSAEKIGERNRKKVRAAIANHTRINGYAIRYG
jgi:hypothetical protein